MTRPDENFAPEELAHDLVTRLGTVYGLEEARAMLDCLAEGAPTKGPRLLQFERAFAEFTGVKHAAAVSSGTGALAAAYAAAQVGPGDEVIVPAITWVATASAAALLGAHLVFADVLPENLNIDPRDVARKITDRTKAITPVHLYGQPADMDALHQVAAGHPVLLIEDAAHAPGAADNGRRTGSLGHLAAFSFHMQKNMSTLGEGGMVTTNDSQLAERVRDFRSHGQETGFATIGTNYRMTEVQAAVGLVQLHKLTHLNDVRRRNAHLLRNMLEEVAGLRLLEETADRLHVYHLLPLVLQPEVLGVPREVFLERLAAQGLHAGTHYPCVHLLPCYRDRGHAPGECPVAEATAPNIVTLPMHPRMTVKQMEYVARVVAQAAEGG